MPQTKDCMDQKKNNLSLEEKRKLPMFFIIARPRSGTTLLRTLFDRHSNVVIPLESPFILRFYWKYHKVKVWDEEKILEFFNDITNKDEDKYLNLNISAWQIDYEQLKKDLLALANHTTYAELCRVVNASYQSFFPKKKITLVGDKNPVYSPRSPYLLKLFPDAKFLHMTRDYRDYLQSMLRAGFVKKITPIIIHRWVKSLKINLDLQKKYPEKFHFFKYEDLVQEPEKTFKEICTFLNLPYEEQIFDFHEYKNKFLEFYREKDMELYHSKLFRPISSKNVGDWKQNLTHEQLEVAELMAGKHGEKIGYPRSLKKISMKTRLKVQPVRLYLFTTKLVGDILRTFPHKTGLRQFIERGPVLGKKYWDNVKEKS